MASDADSGRDDRARQWHVALRLLRAIAALPVDSPARAGRIREAHRHFLASDDEHLRKLARVLAEGMDDRQLLCALVPVERVAARERITDAEMQLTSSDSTSAASSSFPLTVVADNIRSAVNIGGIFRTAEFFGAESLWLCGYTATPEHPHVVRSAMGAEATIPWRTFRDVRDAIAELRSAGVAIYALETASNAIDAAECAYQFPAALLLGNERFGLDPETVSLADAVVSIRAYGTKNSLNVVSAFAIAAHEMRKRNDRK